MNGKVPEYRAHIAHHASGVPRSSTYSMADRHTPNWWLLAWTALNTTHTLSPEGPVHVHTSQCHDRCRRAAWQWGVLPFINNVYIHKMRLGQSVGLGGGASVGLAPLGGSMGGQVEANQPIGHPS